MNPINEIEENREVYERRDEMKKFFEESEKVDSGRGVKYTCPLWRENCSLIRAVLGEINTRLGIYNYPTLDPSKVDMDLCTGNSEPMFHCCEIYQRQSKIIENSLAGMRKKIRRYMAKREPLEEA